MYSWMLASVLIMGILYWWLFMRVVYTEGRRYHYTSISLYMRALEKKKGERKAVFSLNVNILYTHVPRTNMIDTLAK